MKKLSVLLLACLLLLTFVSCSKKTETSSDISSVKVEINISAAASLTESLNEISALYKTEKPNVTLTFNFGASGTLQTQIEEGAAADVFISAAQKQMNALESKDFLLSGTRKDLLVNKVVLIVPSSSSADLKSFEDCLSDKVKMIAIGDPESVPVGQYTKEIFTSLNGWDEISAKANLASDVKQVLSWTETGVVDCGIVYSTDANSSDKVKVVAEAPEGSHSPVVYPAALMKSTTIQEEAHAFLDFLSTDKAKQVFTGNGFTIA
jgi:molybdate transport system substrate-binding protein